MLMSVAPRLSGKGLHSPKSQEDMKTKAHGLQTNLNVFQAGFADFANDILQVNRLHVVLALR